MIPAHLDETKIKTMKQMYESNKGEMNLFVIRDIAAKQKDGLDMVLQELSEHYKILFTKAVPWHFRWFKAHKMRGGKWKRGGKPALSVIVFDPAPITVNSASDDTLTHPLVFNARQFFKPAFREKFSATYKTKPKLNPLHSTDNEYEAQEHLPLLFSSEDIKKIYALCKSERCKL